MNEPSGESDQCDELDPGVTRQILGIATDDFGEIWYMIRENETAYKGLSEIVEMPGQLPD
ncbi:MAG: hypothetical protein K8S15_02365 [Candidatus Aegiribacteria sp.]|nr:hypothetical protein [Candidatus Aegiribacteria sp.]